MMGDSVMKRNGLYLAESNAIGQLKLPYDADFSEIKEREMFQGATSMPSHLRSGGSVFFPFNFSGQDNCVMYRSCPLSYVDD